MPNDPAIFHGFQTMDAVNLRRLIIIPVEFQVISEKQINGDAESKCNAESQNVDDYMGSVLEETPKGDPDVITEHEINA